MEKQHINLQHCSDDLGKLGNIEIFMQTDVYKK